MESKGPELEFVIKGLILRLIRKYCMPQLQITTETMIRMKKIVGINHVHDGDFMVNEMIDILEKKIRERR